MQRMVRIGLAPARRWATVPVHPPPPPTRSTAAAPAAAARAPDRRRSSRERRPQSGRQPQRPYRRSSPTTRSDDSGGSAVPQSLDVGLQTSLMDVEKFFPSAMAHLKSHDAAPADVLADQAARRWHVATHTVNVDGFRDPVTMESEEDAEARVHSFFDEGSLDIRGGLRGGAVANLPSPDERHSPDVLQLTGGALRRHGTVLATKSNAAPADVTQEPEDDGYSERDGGTGTSGPFGDTPPQLTDMLKERLMELKGERLREERTDTFLPRRLRLKTDAELAAEQRRSDRLEIGEATGSTQGQLLRLATAAAGGRHRSSTTTLADLEPLDDVDGGVSVATACVGGKEGGELVPAILRDGITDAQRARVVGVLRHAHDYEASLPALGGNTAAAALDPFADVSQSLDRPSTSRVGPHGSGVLQNGSVYLLRVLPRASFCSRREAAAMVASGQVRVNNVVERNPFRLVRPEDDVHVAGHASRLRYAPPRLWMYHKPANVIVSRNDVAGRTLIGKHARILGMDHLIPVGSLPMRAHGILLLTNDGELSRYLENPKAHLQQTYLLRVRPAVDAVLAHKLNTEGVNINGRQYKGAMEFLVNPAAKSRYSLKVKVRGETMPISHLMQHLGRKIERGGRVSFGPYALSTLPVGSVREVTIPAFYADHLGAVWRPFVERDWPYFRRQRVRRLRQLARYRELTPRELAELDDFTYEEMQDALRFDAQELDTAEQLQQQQQRQRPSFFAGKAITDDFPVGGRPRAGSEDVDTLEGTGWAECGNRDDDAIVEDITSIV